MLLATFPKPQFRPPFNYADNAKRMMAYPDQLANAISVKVEFITQLGVDQAHRTYLYIINNGKRSP